MKSEQEFLQGVYRKANALQAERAGRAGAPRRARRFTSPAVAAALLVAVVGGLVFFGDTGASELQTPPAQESPSARGIAPAAFGLTSEGIPAEASLADLVQAADAVLLIRYQGDGAVVLHRFLTSTGTPQVGETLPLAGFTAEAGPEREGSEAVCFLREEEGTVSLLSGGNGLCFQQEDGSFQGVFLRFTQEQLEEVIESSVSEK